MFTEVMGFCVVFSDFQWVLTGYQRFLKGLTNPVTFSGVQTRSEMFLSDT